MPPPVEGHSIYFGFLACQGDSDLSTSSCRCTERIRGELLKLGLRVSKRTIQKYLPKDRTPQPSQTWGTFLGNHAESIWACDFIQVTDVFFRGLFVFVMIELGSRRIVHVGVTRQPTDGWVAQQVREATPFGQGPRFLLRDNDCKYGQHVWAVTEGAGIEVLRTPIGAPKANATCERFIGSVRRECLDHLLLFDEKQGAQVMKQYTAYFNQERPHQGLGQRVPVPSVPAPIPPPAPPFRVIGRPVLNGLHHAYQWQAAYPLFTRWCFLPRGIGFSMTTLSLFSASTGVFASLLSLVFASSRKDCTRFPLRKRT
ncbi:MAG: hypothetical protein DPW18_20720 [Chloroflexi bacterium]|nr:hypothetical protein [Chloroflexota bacterium]